jgi:hypothetical protein
MLGRECPVKLFCYFCIRIRSGGSTTLTSGHAPVGKSQIAPARDDETSGLARKQTARPSGDRKEWPDATERNGTVRDLQTDAQGLHPGMNPERTA